MSPEECDNRLRFRLGDNSGVLCIEEFAIADAPECRDMQRTLREYLVGRPLSDVDLDYLRALKCPADGQCMRAMMWEVEKYQRLFTAKTELGSVIRK